MRRLLSALFILVVILVLTNFSVAQQVTSPPAPASSSGEEPQEPVGRKVKIGVALEGGGALGLAHIGVLQWLEDHRIPVDYVAGTSMGGLVGGLYATGKSPKELQELVSQQSWDIIIGGRTPYEDLSFRRKEDKRAYPNYLILGLKNGLSLPAGLNAGQRISLLIDHETLPYVGLKSFSDLPIPFRCVATDLVSGKQVVFSDGDLATAMRATMSIPGLFTPVRDGEHVYVDGGLVGNLPTDVVRQMGADIVIGVHLETAPANAKDIQSLFSVLGRSIDVVIHENEIRGLAGADLVVSVDLKDFTSMDYGRSKRIIEKGEGAAHAKEHTLSPFSLDEGAWRDYLRQREEKKKNVIAVPQFVEVQGVKPEAKEPIERFLSPLAGRPIDPAKLDALLTRLAGIGKFDTAGYRLQVKDGRTGLVILLHEQSYGPPTLQPGFEVDGSESKDVTFTQAARLTVMDIAGYRSEWRTDFLFGNTYGVASELYRPFTATSKWFLAPHADASTTGFRVYSKNDPLAIYGFDRQNIGVDVGYGFNRFSEIRAGYSVGRFDANLRLGRPEFGSESGRVGDTRVRFRIDHADDPVVPRRGYRGEINFQWYDSFANSSSGFPAADARLEYFQPVTRPGSVFVGAEGGSTFGTNSGGFPQYFLGGPTHLSAYGTNELFGNQYYLFQVGYLHQLLTLPPFLGKNVYALGSFEAGKMYAFPLRTESKFPEDVALGVVAETALGPFFVGGSVGDSGHRKWFFQLGRVF
jgi:NTE family protein